MKILNNLKKLKPKITKLDLEIKFGLEDVVITSYLIVAISVFNFKYFTIFNRLQGL